MLIVSMGRASDDNDGGGEALTQGGSTWQNGSDEIYSEKKTQQH